MKPHFITSDLEILRNHRDSIQQQIIERQMERKFETPISKREAKYLSAKRVLEEDKPGPFVDGSEI